MDLTLRMTPAYRRSAADTDVDVPVTVRELDDALTLALTVEGPAFEETTYAVAGTQMYRLYDRVPPAGVLTRTTWSRGGGASEARWLAERLVASGSWLWEACDPPLARVTINDELYLTDTSENSPSAVTVPVWYADWLEGFFATVEAEDALDGLEVRVHDASVLPDMPVPEVFSVIDRFETVERIGFIARRAGEDLTYRNLADLVELAQSVMREVDPDED